MPNYDKTSSLKCSPELLDALNDREARNQTHEDLIWDALAAYDAQTPGRGSGADDETTAAVRDLEAVEEELAAADGMESQRERLTEARATIVEELLDGALEAQADD